MILFKNTVNKPIVKLKDSIATHLLTVVFSIYFIVALTVTLIHMIAEYSQEKNKILNELTVYNSTFHKGLSKAIWNLDDEQIVALLTGINQNPIVIGVKIVGLDNEIIKAVGTYVNQKNEIVENMSSAELTSEQALFFDDLFSHDFTITYIDIENRPNDIGRLVIYSSTSIIFKNVRLGFIFIIVNSVIKTLALWFIFLYVSQFLLSRPLAELNEATHTLDMGNLENNKVHIQTKGPNELTLIGDAFNKMTDKLALSKYRLASYQKVYSILTSNTFKNSAKLLFREICSNAVITNGVLYLNKGETFHASNFFNPNMEFLPDKLQWVSLQSLSIDNDLPVIFNDLKEDTPIIQNLPSHIKNNLISGHLLILKFETKHPAIIVLFRNKKLAPFDISDSDYLKGMLNEINNSQKNINILRDKSKIEGEMVTASLVQQSFIPKETPQIPGFEVAYLFTPAKSVSGDYFDFVSTGDTSHGFVIADVSGKGVPAAMYANMARILLRDKSRFYKTPKKLLSELNQSLKNEFQENRFLTMSYLSLDCKESCLQYASAGHEPVLLLRKDTDKVELLKPPGYPFSALHADIFDSRLKEESLTLYEGDLIFCYTDGLTDIINYRNEMYGEERLYHLISKYKNYPVEELVEKVNQALLAYQGDSEQLDDMTVIALKKV